VTDPRSAASRLAPCIAKHAPKPTKTISTSGRQSLKWCGDVEKQTLNTKRKQQMCGIYWYCLDMLVLYEGLFEKPFSDPLTTCEKITTSIKDSAKRSKHIVWMAEYTALDLLLPRWYVALRKKQIICLTFHPPYIEPKTNCLLQYHSNKTH